MRPMWVFVAPALVPAVIAGQLEPQLKLLGTLSRDSKTLISVGHAREDLEREKPTRTDQEAIQGTWKIVDAISAGEKVPNVDKGNLLFIFEGDKLETRALDKVETRGTFKLGPRKNPKTFDGHIAGEGRTQLGIYELEGDKLKLCLPNRGRTERPSEFSSTNDNQCSLFILERKN